MVAYASEHFTPSEREVLRPYVTNLDSPVFALVNLPEVVKGALFARYSRSSKSLRRLFLDEFVEDLDTTGDASVDASVGLRRAEQLYARVFGDYGDDSVAQLGGVHLACEQASNVLTKVLERGRLMSYLEQSTRYIPYDVRLSSGHYRYYRDPELLESSLGARYVGEMDRMFDTYGELLPRLSEHLTRVHPPTGTISPIAYRQSVRARALDALRGLLPAGSLSNVGIYGSGQSYELLLLKMRGHPLPEVRRYAELMVDELRKVIPSFLTRLDRPERGGVWSEYLAGLRQGPAGLVAELWPELADQAAGDTVGGSVGIEGSPSGQWSVDLVDYDPEGEEKVLTALCYPFVNCSEQELAERVHRLGPDERTALFAAGVGERSNRRHRPGRAFERTAYRFDVVSDYGAFRDLQRHRMLTVEWQGLSTNLGYEIPGLVAEAGLGDAYAASQERSRELHAALVERFPEQATYAVALGFHIRYSLHCSAREAMHITELRSTPQGHPAYRAIVQEMHRQIAEVAGHQAIAAAMRFVDHSDAGLGRLESEERAAQRRLTAEGG
ncbi:MAG: putative thymidylate synthase [Acidimicrobiaceae bacterium]|nr:putative thymidylate synthase [Acidimicrobiaceae bacterium]